MVKIDLYEVCLSYFIYCLPYYNMTILTPMFTISVVSITPGAKSSGIFGHNDPSQNRTSNEINGEGKGF